MKNFLLSAALIAAALPAAAQTPSLTHAQIEEMHLSPEVAPRVPPTSFGEAMRNLFDDGAIGKDGDPMSNHRAAVTPGPALPGSYPGMLDDILHPAPLPPVQGPIVPPVVIILRERTPVQSYRLPPPMLPPLGSYLSPLWSSLPIYLPTR